MIRANNFLYLKITKQQWKVSTEIKIENIVDRFRVKLCLFIERTADVSYGNLMKNFLWVVWLLSQLCIWSDTCPWKIYRVAHRCVMQCNAKYIFLIFTKHTLQISYLNHAVINAPCLYKQHRHRRRTYNKKNERKKYKSIEYSLNCAKITFLGCFLSDYTDKCS